MTATSDLSIRNQVEFYFSEGNLPFDRYLYRLTQKNKGWVEIDEILRFKRMQKLSATRDLVINSLKSSDLLEIDEDQKRLRRKQALKPPSTAAFDRTAYAKGFPTGEEDERELQIEIEQFFKSLTTEGNKILQVRLRREDDEKNTFKGSVYVEFATIEGMKSFITMFNEKEESPKFREKCELVVMSKADFIEQKKKENNEESKAPNFSHSRQKRRFNAFKEQKHSAVQDQGKRGQKRERPSLHEDVSSNKDAEQESNAEDVEENSQAEKKTKVDDNKDEKCTDDSTDVTNAPVEPTA